MVTIRFGSVRFGHNPVLVHIHSGSHQFTKNDQSINQIKKDYPGHTAERANLDLWTILFHRTTGTAKLKLKTTEGTIAGTRKAGIDAFRAINHWYTMVGGWGISDMRSKLINPPAVNEAQIIQAIESYESDYKDYLELGGGELGNEYRTQALKNMLTGELRRYIHLHFSDGNYDALKQQVVRYAMLSIKDSRVPGAPMFTIQPGSAPYNNAQPLEGLIDPWLNWCYDQQQQYPDYQAMDENGNLASLGKGKGPGPYGGKNGYEGFKGDQKGQSGNYKG